MIGYNASVSGTGCWIPPRKDSDAYTAHGGRCNLSTGSLRRPPRLGVGRPSI